MKQTIIKSLLDENSYKSINLNNGLEVLLISNQVCEESFASLVVGVGALQDPEEFQGLAHLVEHCILGSCEIYPDQNFLKFVSQYDDIFNSATDLQTTQFQLKCASQNLFKILERFSQYLKSADFSENSIINSLQIVQRYFQQTQASKEQDLICVQLLRNISIENQSFCQFGHGNMETLKFSDKLKSAVVQFYNKYYSANLMKLVIFGREGVDVLEIWAKQFFEQIKNCQTPFEKLIQNPFRKEFKKLKIHSKIDKQFTRFNWIIEDYSLDAIKYVEKLFQRVETELPLQVQKSLILDKFVIFQVQINGSPSKEYMNLIKNYLNQIMNEGVNEQFFNEFQKTDLLIFNYEFKLNSINQISQIALKMLKYEISHVLVHDYLWDSYDQPKLINFLKQMNDQNLIVIEAQSDQIKNIQEKNYIQYEVSDSYEESQSKNILKLPKFNQYIPDHTKLEKITHNDQLKCILNENRCQVWHKFDSQYKKPYSALRLKLFTVSQSQNRALFHIYSFVFESLFKYKFSQDLKYIRAALSHFNILNVGNDIILEVQAFSDSFHKILQKIFHLLKNEFVQQNDKQFFTSILTDFLKTVSKSLNQWDQLENEFQTKLGLFIHYDKKQIFNEIQNADFNQFQTTIQEWISSSKSIWQFKLNY